MVLDGEWDAAHHRQYMQVGGGQIMIDGCGNSLECTGGQKSRQ